MQVSFGALKSRPVQTAARGRNGSSFAGDKVFLEQCAAAVAGSGPISKGSSGRYDAWNEKNRDKDFGVLMGGGVSADKPMNWDADGTSKLTQEQIDYLKSTYDLSDMSKQEYYDLMADLTNMNAISIDDVLSQYMKPMVPGVVVMSVSEGESMGGFGHMNHFGDIQGNLLQYMRDLNSMLERMANGQSSMDRNTFMAFRDYLEKEKDLSKRLEFIFDLIA